MANSQFAMTQFEALTIAAEHFKGVDPRVAEVLAHMVAQKKAAREAQAARPKVHKPSDASRENLTIAQMLHKLCPDSFSLEYVCTHTEAITPQKAACVMKVGIEAGMFTKDKVNKRVVYFPVR